MELEHYQFATTKELMALGSDHRWLLTVQNQRDQTVCVFGEKTAPCKVIWLKTLN